MSSNPWIVTGFYTVGTPYEDEVAKLRASCDQHGVRCRIYPVPDQGNWRLNCGLKPQVLLKALREYPESNIVYIDADGIIRQYPSLFDTMSEDIGIHYRKRGSRLELLSGTIYLKNTEAVHLTIQDWIDEQKKQQLVFDQVVFDQVLKRNKRNVSILDLPPTYTQIYDTMKGAGKPVIEHFQASRRFRKRTDPIQSNRLINHPDGSFSLIRPDRTLEQQLEQTYVRTANSLQFYPRLSSNLEYSSQVEFFSGNRCYIVGKGPSLDLIRRDHFSNPAAPIICINESIRRIEELDLPNRLYAIQQDAGPGDCKPRAGVLFCSRKASEVYPRYGQDIIIFHPEEFQQRTSSISVVMAIHIAKGLNCRRFDLFCFDATVNSDLGYANCIGYEPIVGGNPKRFLRHREMILKALKGCDATFHIPGQDAKYRPNQLPSRASSAYT